MITSAGNQTEVTSFQLNNDSGFAFNIAWIDYNGQITASGQPTMQPGRSWTIANGARTWESHWFAISSAAGFVCSISIRQGVAVNFSQLPGCSAGNANQFAGQAQAASAINWAHSLENLGLSTKISHSYSFSCPAGGYLGAAVWGTDIYTADSSICVAAVHRVLISAVAGGAVRLRIQGGQQGYNHSQHNGVSRPSYGPWQSSFSFH